MLEATLCHVLDGRRLLLKKASRGISVGKWNAPGGKIEKGETPEENAVREVREETSLVIGRPFFHGVVDFFMGGGDRLDIRVHVFSTKRFEGSPTSSEEGEVRWFDVSRLPYGKMWDDDRYWVQLMLAGSRFDAKFWYDRRNEKVAAYEIRSRKGSTSRLG